MRIVIKLGTNLLTRSSGRLDKKNISKIVEEIGGLIDKGIQVVIVSSGAIGAGCGKLKCKPSELNIMEKQAVASVGQTDLMNTYREAFSVQKRLVGQMLLTSQDLADRKGYLNIRNTIFTLLKMNIVPVINENDSVAVDEIKFGDNDYLAAVITSKIDADKLIILTDVDGLLSDDNKLIKDIEIISPQIIKYAGGKGSEFSVGGMLSKIRAAEMVNKICCADVYIANGRKTKTIIKIIDEKNPGTHIKGNTKVVSHKKRWIAYGLRPSGSVVIDVGAARALLKKNSSLLAVGIKNVRGSFNAGDSVNCMDEKGKNVARGLVNYSSKDIRKITGKKSSEIEEVLGHKDYDEVIHKDNLVLM